MLAGRFCTSNNMDGSMVQKLITSRLAVYIFFFVNAKPHTYCKYYLEYQRYNKSQWDILRSDDKIKNVMLGHFTKKASKYIIILQDEYWVVNAVLPYVRSSMPNSIRNSIT